MRIEFIFGLAAILVISTFLLSRAQAVFFETFDVDGSNFGIRVLAYRLVVWLHIVGATSLYSDSIFQTDVTSVLPDTFDEPVGAAVVTGILLSVTILIGIYARTVGFDEYRVVGNYQRFQAPGREAMIRKWIALSVAVMAGALLVQSYQFGLITVELPWIATGLVVLYGAYLIAIAPVQPAWGHTWNRTRNPTTDEQQRIRQCYDRFGRDPDRIVIFDAPAEVPGVFTSGTIPRRYTYIHASLLRDARDQDLAVALALSEELATRRYPAIQLAGGKLASAGLAYVIVHTFVTASLEPTFVPLAPLLGAAGVILVLSHGSVLRAEAFAAREMGNDALVSAYQHIGHRLTMKQRNDIGIPSFLRRFHPDPPIAWRLERLAEQGDE